MDKNNQFTWRLKRWQTIILFGFLLMIIYALGTYFFDFFAGEATVGFGRMGQVWGVGMFFIYMIGYFVAIIVILPILIFKNFGIGILIFLPYAIIGFFVEYYYEWLSVQSLKGVWAVFVWSIIGLLIGLSADITYKYLPKKISLKLKSIIMGIIIAIANFVLTFIVLRFCYKIPLPVSPVEPGSFLGVAYFGLPWLIANSGFGGFTAYAINKELKPHI